MRSRWSAVERYMGPQERKFKKEYASELYTIAEADLITAREILPLERVRNENKLFHIEQAIEKGLKAALCALELPVPFSHDLASIVQKFPKGQTPPGGDALADLTPYATVRRYEEGKFEITKDELHLSLDLAQQVLDWVRKKIK